MLLLTKLYVGAGLALALLLGAWALLHAHDVRVRAAQEAAYTAAALKATNENRAEEQRRVAAQKDINDETQRLATRARADARAVTASAPSLRNAFASACFRAAPEHSTTVPGVATAASGVDLQSDVFGQIEQRLRDLARIADERGIAGESCVKSYDALNQSLSLGKLKLGTP